MITQRFGVNHLSGELYHTAGEIHHTPGTDRKPFGCRNNVAGPRSAMTAGHSGGHDGVEIIYCPADAPLSSLVVR